MTAKPNPPKWECFRDDSYFGLACLRRSDARDFHSGIHIQHFKEAEALRDLLNEYEQKIRDLQTAIESM